MILRIFLAVSLIVLTFACAQKDAGKGLNKSTEKKGASGPPPSDDVAHNAFPDSSVYIGYVDYFGETREFYTSLFFREGHEYPDDDLLAARLDSVIAYDDDWGRERLPMEDARNMLRIAGLDSLSVFNRRNELICRCPLVRVEYLWNGLENYFIAVFAHGDDNFVQTEELYGISAKVNFTHAPAAAEIQAPSLNTHLQKVLALDPAMEWDMRHYHLTSPERTFSIVSAYSLASSEAISYLIMLEHDSVHVLNKEVNNFHYLNILPLPLNVNGQPLLLVSAGYPSSDVLWDYLAAFDSAGYGAVEYNRIGLSSLQPSPPGEIPSRSQRLQLSLKAN